MITGPRAQSGCKQVPVKSRNDLSTFVIEKGIHGTETITSKNRPSGLRYTGCRPL